MRNYYKLLLAGVVSLLLLAGFSWVRPYVLAIYHLERGGILLERSLVAVYPDRLAPEQIVDITGFSAAVAHLEESVRLDPRNIQALRLLGRAYLSLEQPEMALRLFQKALLVRPRNPLLHLELGDVYDSLGYAEDVVREYEAGGIGSRSIPLIVNYLKLADAQMEMGSGELAIGLWYRVLAFDPNNLYALYSLYKIHQRMGDTRSAEFHLERLSTINPEAPTVQMDFRLAEYQAQAVIALIEEGIWNREKLLLCVSQQVRRSENFLARLTTIHFIRTLLERWPHDADLRLYLDLLQGP